MGERSDILESKHPGAALDGMRHPENGVHPFRIGRADVELQEGRLHAVERLETFFEKRPMKLCEIEIHCRRPCQVVSLPRPRTTPSPKAFAARRKPTLQPTH